MLVNWEICLQNWRSDVHSMVCSCESNRDEKTTSNNLPHDCEMDDKTSSLCDVVPGLGHFLESILKKSGGVCLKQHGADFGIINVIFEVLLIALFHSPSVIDATGRHRRASVPHHSHVAY